MEKLQQWQRIKEIVGSALERPPAERGAYLDGVCSNEPELRAEVESLLAAYHDTQGLPENPWDDTSKDSGEQPTDIGPYRLLKELGSGGMGQVWLAEQTEPVRRQVALKLIRAGMYDAATVQRFRAERQSLAIMDHPAIAKVFDAGTTISGQPYFVMEYVDGICITDYCDAKKLSIRERLQLFIRVCEGVQHAHQKAIIHRDLKPSNILVAEIDGKPLPRIIDFGLAKAAAPLMPGETQMTQIGAFLGTPGYMSPEQADLGCDIDTRTDVYSLGVILYELLSGLLPFDTSELKKHPEEFVRRLCQDDPPRPSTKLSTNRETASGSAAVRGTDVTQLIALLRGDLDWITMKSLERDRERRYATPLALASDLKNYLENRPITARPASLGYRARKYVRRHATGIAIVAGAAALLIAFAITQAIQLRRVTRERDRADRISGFMTRMFTVSNPSEARGNAVTAREILDRSAKEIDTSLKSDPELQAKMMYTMALTYRGLGLYPRAQLLQERALLIQRRDLGEAHRDTLRSMNNLATILRDEGHNAEAQKISSEALETSRRVLGPRDPETLRLMVTMGSTLYQQGHYEDAEKLFREGLETQRVVLGPEDRDTLGSMNDLAAAYYQESRYPEAEKLGRESLQIRRRVLGPDHPDTLASMMNLANALNQEGHFQEAEAISREALNIQRQVLGPEHPDTLLARSVLATSLNGRGDYAGAEELRRETLEIQRRVLGPAHPETMLNTGALALDLSHQQRYREAEKLFREELEVATSTKRAELISAAWYDFACGMALAGRRNEAFLNLQRAIDEGHQVPEDIAADDDLKSLHGDPRFEVLLTRARNRLTATRQ
jgi:non-specific serine/threonine protein kinase/serine/threonine-protein kinase